MARIEEIQQDEAGPSSSNVKKDDASTLTASEREQILFQSGALGKLGLPKDFITLEEAQQQLAKEKAKGKKQNAKPAPLHPEWATDSEDQDSQDDYGMASDDDAEKLMREQEANEMSPDLEKALDLVIWTMPFAFLFTLLHVLVRQQYGETVGFWDQLGSLIGTLPRIFIWYNLHSQRKVLLQVVQFLISCICGSALVYVVNKSPYDVVMRRVPPLGTLWIFAIVRMELLPACVSLGIVAAYVQYADHKIVFDV